MSGSIRFPGRFLGKVLGVAALATAAMAAVPAPAQAWWVRGGYWGPRVVVGPPLFVPPPVVVAAPPPVVVGPPRPFWVAAHWDRFGRWHPGHWA